MSTLLEQASLVMIPSGYKEDVVYSQIPTSGAGDLSFTRASNGTRVNSAGVVEVVPWNLAQNSETFNVSPWTAFNVGITTNATTAPNGTATAEKLMVTTANTPHQVQQSFNNDTANHTVFIYAKKSELNFVQLALGNSTEQYANFNLNTGVVGTKGGYCASSSIESVGNGWYKCSAYFNQGTVPSLMVYVTNSASSDWGGVVSYSGANNTDGIFVWGYQLNIGSTAKPYFPTTDRLNVPRLTYQNGGGGCPSLLLEKQSTNYITYSEQFDNSDWTKQNISITANATTSPDGTQNADKIIANTTNARHLTYQAIYAGVGTLTYSVFAKAGENSFLIMRLDNDTPEVSTWFNLSNGTIATTYGGSPTIQSMGNGWYRCSVNYTVPSAQTIYAVLYTAKTDNQQVFSGNNSDGTFLWGAQLEVGSYPTSYIPTTSSSATRVADACFKTGISSLIGQTEGVVFWDIQVDIAVATGLGNILNIDGGSFNNTIYLYKVPAGDIVAEMYVSSVLQASFTLSSITAGRYKMAFAYALNNTAFFVNGTQVGTTDTSCTVPAMSRLQMGDGALGSSDGKVNQAILFPTRLTNAELSALTTI